jgi:plastocyanin
MITKRTLSLLTLALASALSLRANDVTGTITIEHKLTKPRVTPTGDLYERGVAVPLAAGGQKQDPLSYEREHVVIYIEGDYASHPVTAELNQQDRGFTPDLVMVPVGSTVSFPNLDPIFHNVFSLSKVKSFDLGNYSKDHTRMVTFDKPGIVFVGCHLHANMSAVIVVTPNKWGAMADPEGHFTLRDVPPGTYTVVAWHKSAGFFRKKIEVTADHKVSVDFAIPIDEDGAPIQEARK